MFRLLPSTNVNNSFPQTVLNATLQHLTSYNPHSLLHTYPSKSRFWLELLRSMHFLLLLFCLTYNINLSRMAALADAHNPFSKSVFITRSQVSYLLALCKRWSIEVFQKWRVMLYLSCCNIRDAIFTFF